MTRSNGAGRHDLRGVPDAPGGLAGDLPTSTHNNRRELTPIAVVDVYDVQRRVRALARIDLLDRERRAGKLDEASYLVGRTTERVFEHLSRISGGGQWCEGDRLDPATQAAVAAAHGFDKAIKVNAYLGWLVRHLGRRDARLLWNVLGLRLNFQTVALAEDRPGIRGVRYIADRFRDALAVLAEAKAARGRDVKSRVYGR